jgi:hypothetical protein
MTEILAFGTIWFWILITVISGVIIWITEEENDGIWSSNIWFIGTLVALYFLGNSESFKEIGTYIIQNPGVAIGIFGAYILVGSIWSIIKWFFYLKRVKSKHEKYGYYSSFDIKDYKIDRNKERVLHWMIYWPLSSLWTLINDPVKKAFEFVLSQFGGFYDKMSEKILGDIVKEKEKAKENNGK